MTRAVAAQPETLLSWMEGLADPTRLRLLRLLERHELGVVDLCDVLQAPQSTVSRHLKVLGDGGWVRGRREGTTNLYRMILDELEAPARRLWLLAREQTDTWSTVAQDRLRLERRLREREEKGGEAFFAGAAGEWDKVRSELYGQAFGVEAMLAMLPAGYVVADLGCGTGRMSEQLAGHVKQVIAVDNSPAMLKAAKKRLEGRENVDLRRGEVEALPIESGSCDAAVLVLVLTYVAEPAKGIGETARVLKPGGRGVIVDLLPHDRPEFRRVMGQKHMGFSPGDVERWMGEAGFARVSCRALPPEPAAKGPALFLAAGVRLDRT